MGNTQTGTHAHTETVETVLLGQWEYVSAYYSLWFSVSTFLGFIMWRMCSCRVLGVRYTNRRPCYLGATISWNSWKKRGRKREKCAEQFCALFSSFPGHSCSCVLKMLERWTLQFYPHFILHLGRKIVYICHCVFSCSPGSMDSNVSPPLWYWNLDNYLIDCH